LLNKPRNTETTKASEKIWSDFGKTHALHKTGSQITWYKENCSKQKIEFAVDECILRI
jgi:hypothetical protein